MVSSLSIRSFSAVTKILGILMFKNMCESPLNHPTQCFSVYLRFIFQQYFFLPLCSHSASWGGIETLADSALRSVDVCKLHLIAASWESKCLGRSERIWFIKGNASRAVPSTTSIITHPTNRYYFSVFVRTSVTLAATDPPNECPIITQFLSGNLCKICLNI